MYKCIVQDSTVQSDSWENCVQGALAQFPELQLETVRTWALQEITRQRGEARRQWLVDTFAQVSVHVEKVRQATAFVTDLAPTKEKYLHLYGEEAKARKLTPVQMSEYILKRNTEWLAASDRIEAVSFQAWEGIEQARNVDEIRQTLIQIEWPQNGK